MAAFQSTIQLTSPNSKARLGFMVLVVFALGLIFRVTVMGWLMATFGLLELVVRLGFLVISLLFLRDTGFTTPAHVKLLLATCASYLLASLLTVDFNGHQSYTLLHLWIDPPPQILAAYLTLVGVVLALQLVMVVQLLKFRQARRQAAHAQTLQAAKLTPKPKHKKRKKRR